MDPISEIGSKGMGENADDDAHFNEDHGNEVDYITGLPVNSWDDSALMSDHYLKGVADNDNKRFFNANASDDQVLSYNPSYLFFLSLARLADDGKHLQWSRKTKLQIGLKLYYLIT